MVLPLGSETDISSILLLSSLYSQGPRKGQASLKQLFREGPQRGASARAVPDGVSLRVTDHSEKVMSY